MAMTLSLATESNQREAIIMRPMPNRTTSANSFQLTLTTTLVVVSFVVAFWSITDLSTVHNNYSRKSLAHDVHSAMPPPLHTRKLSTTALNLSNLTQQEYMECPRGLVFVEDRILHHKTVSNTNDNVNKIPLVIHQTSKSRCLVPSLVQAVKSWKSHLPHYDYYLHDDAAVERLLRLPHVTREFPLLKQVALHCTRGAMRADLWRYVLLWEYGGIYSDVDTYPNVSFVLPHNTTNAYFVLEKDGLLSQYFMAIAPKHTLLKYTIQHTIENILNAPDPFKAFAPTTTGPRALHEGFQTWCGKKYDVPDSTGKWLGENLPIQHGGLYTVNGLTVQVDGDLNASDSIIVRDVVPRETKKRLYRQMNMTYFMQDARTAPQGQSCRILVQQHEEKEGEVD